MRFLKNWMRTGRLFFLVSGLLALLFIGLDFGIEQRSQQQLLTQLELEAQGFRNGFEMSHRDLQLQMLTLASLLAENNRVQTLFHQGARVLDSEGGGAGQAEAAFWRSALFNYLGSRWQLMQDQYGLRQLQFHVGPGVTSFLRVHSPGMFGDQMSGIRPVIEDVLQDQQPRSGFETGRSYSGIRGVVPVWFNPPRQPRQFVGVLEAGTSFDTQLQRLDQQYSAGFAVLLKRDYVEQQVWESYRDDNSFHLPEACNCYIEASSRDEIQDWLQQDLFLPLVDDATQSILLKLPGKHVHFTRFALADYNSQKYNAVPVGSVWVWQDKSALILAIHQERLKMRVALVLVYMVALGLLIWLLRLTQRRLQWRVDVAVQQQLNTARALEVSEQRYQNALGAVNDGLWEADFVTGELHWDSRCFEMLGYAEPRDLVIDDWYTFIHPEDLPSIQNTIEEHLANQQSYSIEYRACCADGSWLWVEGRGKVIQWQGDSPHIMTGTVTDISARKHVESELRRLSVTDSLTGLSNRRYFFKRLSALLAACQRKSRPMAVLMLDIDHFKAVNDQHGHAAGDAILMEFSNAVSQLLRQSDLLARLGGEEFAILLPETDAQGAWELAERIRQVVAAARVEIANTQVSVTVSIGISQRLDSDISEDEVIVRADNALYRAKSRGRNRVESDAA